MKRARVSQSFGQVEKTVYNISELKKSSNSVFQATVRKMYI
jgi:hypothetical protein